jgi:hypothetical protein
MEFKLKESWYDYFLSGTCAGITAFMILLANWAEKELKTPVPFELWIGILIFALMSVVFFISACRVKKPKT